MAVQRWGTNRRQPDGRANRMVVKRGKKQEPYLININDAQVESFLFFLKLNVKHCCLANVALANGFLVPRARSSLQLFRPESGSQHPGQFIGGDTKQNDSANDGEFKFVRDL